MSGWIAAAALWGLGALMMPAVLQSEGKPVPARGWALAAIWPATMLVALAWSLADALRRRLP